MSIEKSFFCFFLIQGIPASCINSLEQSLVLKEHALRAGSWLHGVDDFAAIHHAEHACGNRGEGNSPFSGKKAQAVTSRDRLIFRSTTFLMLEPKLLDMCCFVFVYFNSVL